MLVVVETWAGDRCGAFGLQIVFHMHIEGKGKLINSVWTSGEKKKCCFSSSEKTRPSIWTHCSFF
jgi:hypothetical protein